MRVIIDIRKHCVQKEQETNEQNEQIAMTLNEMDA